jgi:hypothetical protein
METLGKSRHVEKEGNTKLPSQPSRKTFYCFTVFYTDDVYDEIIRQLKVISKKGIVGKETCPTTNKKHLQGFIHLNKPMRLSELKITGSPHWEACKGNEEQNTKYCSKENDFVKWGFPKPIKTIDTLFDWQRKVEEIYLQEPDDRTVHWYWNESGNIGKSAFIKYMIVKHKVLFCSGGKHQDIMNLVFNQDMDECQGVFFDIPRAHRGHISYASLESIKNGMVCNTKYETGVKIFNSPHVFVFANFPPDKESELSADRWHIVEL